MQLWYCTSFSLKPANKRGEELSSVEKIRNRFVVSRGKQFVVNEALFAATKRKLNRHYSEKVISQKYHWFNQNNCHVNKKNYWLCKKKKVLILPLWVLILWSIICYCYYRVMFAQALGNNALICRTIYRCISSMLLTERSGAKVV